MIRLIHCVRKRDDLSLEEFRRYWDSGEFAQSIESMARLVGALGFAINATLAVSANRMLMEMRPLGDQFDGVVEYWWDSAAHVTDVAQGDEFKKLRAENEAYQAQFIAMDQSVVFFTEGDRQNC
jgi:hypothetical protein